MKSYIHYKFNKYSSNTMYKTYQDQQRSGIGKAVFADYVARNAVDPNQIAYDRPSPKLFAFLKKHYDLENPDVQPNKFAIYKHFKLK